MPHFFPRDERDVDVSFSNLDAEVLGRGARADGGVRFSYPVAGIRNAICISAEILMVACLEMSGCAADAPAPPDMPRAVTTLAARYDDLTATLDTATARMVLERTIPIQNTLTAFSGLRLLRAMVEHATSLTFENDLTDDVQGSIVARAPCPGWQPNKLTDDAVRGYMEATLGIDNSRVQRAFTARVAQCRFLSVYGPLTSRFEGSMELEVDLGDDTPFGFFASTVLVRATNISGAIDGVEIDFGDVSADVDGPEIDLGKRVLSFRITADDSIDTRIDLSKIHPSLRGVLQIALYADGTWVLRARDGSWVCGGEGSFSCIFVARA